MNTLYCYWPIISLSSPQAWLRAFGVISSGGTLESLKKLWLPHPVEEWYCVHSAKSGKRLVWQNAGVNLVYQGTHNFQCSTWPTPPISWIHPLFDEIYFWYLAATIIAFQQSTAHTFLQQYMPVWNMYTYISLECNCIRLSKHSKPFIFCL